MTMDEGLRRGLRLAGLIVSAGLGLLLGTLRLAEGISGDEAWRIVMGAVLVVLAAGCAIDARRLSAEIQRER